MLRMLTMMCACARRRGYRFVAEELAGHVVVVVATFVGAEMAAIVDGAMVDVDVATGRVLEGMMRQGGPAFAARRISHTAQLATDAKCRSRTLLLQAPHLLLLLEGSNPLSFPTCSLKLFFFSLEWKEKTTIFLLCGGKNKDAILKKIETQQRRFFCVSFAEAVRTIKKVRRRMFSHLPFFL